MATSADDFQSLSPPPEEVENAAEGSAEIDGTDDAPRTRQELDDYIARFKTETKWTYGGRSDGLPIGSWESDDGDRCPARFAKDGEVEVGFIWQKGAGSLAKGIYAISDSGRIAYVARCDGVSLAGWFRVDGAAIYGPRGPLPRVNYVRVKNSD
jgi:hypothetical protein